MGNLNFDSDSTPPANSGFDPLPEGKYEAILTESDVRTTQSGSGKYLKLTFTIFEENYVGRKVWCNLNIENPSAKAQQIGLGMLSALCKACGKSGIVNDSPELHDIPLIIKLSIDESQDKPKNEVKGFFPKEKFTHPATKQFDLINNDVPAENFSDDDIGF